MYETIKILLVEDSPGDARLIEEMLKESHVAKFEITKAKLKSEAIDLLRKNNFDAILLDLNLPDSYGIETCTSFVKEFPLIPIVVLTGNESEQIGEEALRFGAQDYLVKGQVDNRPLARALRFSIERFRIQKQLQESETRFRIMIEKNDDSIIIADKNGITRFINPAAEKLFNKPKEEFLGEKFGYKIELNKPSELLINQNNKNIRYADMSVVEIEWENTLMYLLTLHDITDRKNAENLLRESEERFRLISENSLDLICMVNNDGYFVYASPSFETVLGYSTCNLIDMRLFDLFNQEDFKKIPDWRNNLQATFRMKDAESKWRWMEGSSYTILWKHMAYIIFISRDITDRINAETEIKKLNTELEQRVIQRTAELEAANKELESFSFSVSHDLRAPLRSIDGFSKILLEDYETKLDSTGKDYLNRVRLAVDRMSSLIDDFLKLSRITRVELTRTKVNLSEIAIEYLSELNKANPERKLKFNVSPELYVNADNQLMKILMENLLGNSWKFSRNHAETLIEVGSYKDNDKIVFYIKDNGAGFDMSYINKLFTPFERLHSSNEFEGTGIGLATVQRIIARHGGRIWAEGEIEKGAKFSFILPS